MEEWMSELPEKFHDVPLHKLAIPGSHNSGAFSFELDGGFAPDAPSFLQMGSSMPGIQGICQKWSVCQNLDFKKQLEAGIRYFDLRISRRPPSDDYYFVHTLYGPKLSSLTDAVMEFLSEHKREVIFLDFNHFYNMEEDHHVILIQLLLSVLGDLAFPCGDLDTLTLRNIWDSGKQVIIHYHHDIRETFPELWSPDSMKSMWPNTANLDTCLEFLSTAHSTDHDQKLVVCQGILTPDLSNLLTIMTSSLEATCESFTPKLCEWVSQSSEACKHPLNIVMTDFVEKGSFVKTVLDLNTTRFT